MKKIRIHFFNGSIGAQIFDRFYAYHQSLNRHNKYLSDIIIEYGEPADDAFNIAFCYMPNQEFCNPDLYDLIIVDNAGEALEVATPFIKESLSDNKVYFLCGAFLEKSHPLYKKIIPFNHNIRLFHDTQTQGFYPQYFDRAFAKIGTRKDICYINGSNRSNRQYIMDLIKETGVTMHSTISKEIVEVPDCQFEDNYDSEFRIFVNQLYDTKYHNEVHNHNNISIGINNSHGEMAQGYFMIDNYYNYKCIMFPETQWINHQHFMTEKIFKCFVSGAIPWPIAGARVHAMYNQLGYQTVWNLLPPEHQEFDNDKDHKSRSHKIIQALLWLKENINVLESKQAQDLIKQNTHNFFINTIDTITVTRLQQILTEVDQ